MGIWSGKGRIFSGRFQQIKSRNRLLGLDSQVTRAYKPHPLPQSMEQNQGLGFTPNLWALFEKVGSILEEVRG
tara:strand:- start:176 stop:394 length:219 start_codon:yes stop_codon:yes gene_type:complete